MWRHRALVNAIVCKVIFARIFLSMRPHIGARRQNRATPGTSSPAFEKDMMGYAYLSFLHPGF